MTGKRREESAITTVDIALDTFWRGKLAGGHRPDYSGFTEWVLNAFEAAKLLVLPMHMQGASSSATEFIFTLLRAAKQAGINFEKDGVQIDPVQFKKRHGSRSSLKSLNRAKLLLLFFKDSGKRLLEFANFATSDLDFAEEINSRSSQAQHRFAFFKAIAQGDGNAAFKMLGRLREDDHDPGELEFLEATAYFHQNRPADAIRWADRVERNSVDWPRSFMLQLECHAILGRVERITNAVAQEPQFPYPPLFLEHLCQLAVQSSEGPEEAASAALAMLRSDARGPNTGLGVFPTWNRYSCQLASELVEQLKEAELRSLAEEQHLKNQLQSSRNGLPLRLRQIEAALGLDPTIPPNFRQFAPTRACEYLVQRLVNVASPSPKDAALALVLQWKIGDRCSFLDNILANFESLVSVSTPENLRFLGWAYQEAMTLKREADADRITAALSRSDLGNKLVEDAANLSVLDHLERNLSPMGRFAYRAACLDLSNSDDGKSIWRDAGMLSLGFFRILELETNERLIFTAVGSLDLEKLRSQLSNLQSRKSSRKLTEFWERIFPLLKRAKESRKGLELGPLELLLNKVKIVSGLDAGLKETVHSSLLTALSESGRDAFLSGAFAKVLDGDARERFRNPGAHSRYVDLETARDCRRYVERALQNLVEWTVVDSPSDSKAH